MVNHAVALPVVENDLYSGFTAFVREYANEGTDSALTNTIIAKTAEIILFSLETPFPIHGFLLFPG